jgi:hypothetical protein
LTPAVASLDQRTYLAGKVRSDAWNFVDLLGREVDDLNG